MLMNIAHGFAQDTKRCNSPRERNACVLLNLFNVLETDAIVKYWKVVKQLDDGDVSAVLRLLLAPLTFGYYVT